MNLRSDFSRFANATARATGSPWAFVICLVVVLGWAVSGPLFGFSDTWQLVINTGTTIVTFLMVFLIQNTQNRDGMAIQAKLDELILTSTAENQFIGIEKLTDKELEVLQERCRKQAEKQEKLAAHVEAVRSSRRPKDQDARPPASRPKSTDAKPPAAKPTGNRQARGSRPSRTRSASG